MKIVMIMRDDPKVRCGCLHIASIRFIMYVGVLIAYIRSLGLGISVPRTGPAGSGFETRPPPGPFFLPFTFLDVKSHRTSCFFLET